MHYIILENLFNFDSDNLKIKVLLPEIKDNSGFGIIDSNVGGISPSYEYFSIKIDDNSESIILDLNCSNKNKYTLKQLKNDFIDKSLYATSYKDEKGNFDYFDKLYVKDGFLVLKKE